MRAVVSMVKCALATRPRDVDPESILRAIKTGKWEKPIREIRRLYRVTLLKIGKDQKAAKLAVDPLKKNLPGLLWSGRFARRANDALIEHSGLLCVDLDSLGAKLRDVREKLLTSPHLFALFLSPTGDGLKAIFRVPADASKHLGSFVAVSRHVLDITGVQVDQACKDVARLCFVSYDPQAYFNPNAREIQPLAEAVSPKSRLIRKSAEPDSRPDKAQIREMLAVIPKRPDYADWIRIVAAVGDTLPDEDAIELLKEWSPEERDGEYADKLQHRLENVHIGTLFHLAQQHGWTPKIDSLEKRPDLWKGPEVESSALDKFGSSADDVTIARLAAMPLLDYERGREKEAERLGCRVTVLDSLVEAKRPPKPRADTLQGKAVTLTAVEPWPEAVNGSNVLGALAERFTRYLVLPAGAADVIALWCAHTHCFKIFQCSPRLNVSSAEPRSGKTTLRDVVGLFVPRPVLTENMSTAVLFRLVDMYSPTILADEYDSWLSNSDELRGLFNAGHRRGAMVYRCEGDSNEVRGFAAYAPAALCGIGALPGTLDDRSIVVRLERAKRGELKARFDSRHTEIENQLCRKLVRWCSDNRAALESSDPQLPPGVYNRLADNWRPLFAMAEVAGGDWPKRVAEALAKLTSRANDDVESLRMMLLADIQQIFAGKWPPPPEGVSPSPVEKIFSKDLVENLAE